MFLMPQDSSISMEDLKIKFDGESNQIEANTLINSLLHFTNIVQEVNRELDTDKKVEIKINALAPGSFLVDLAIQAIGIMGASNLFSKQNLEIAGHIVKTVGGLYKAAKFLMGKEPKVIESNNQSTRIENNQGDVIYLDNRVFNIYKDNKIVRESLGQEFQTLENDPNVTGFKLLDRNDTPIVEIGREEFNSIASIEENFTAPDEKTITKIGRLNIASLSFEPNIKWSFYYEGNKIPAKINDEEFVRLIDSGEKFAKGDSLEAELEIKQEYNKSVDAFINKSYKVTKIIKHIPRSEQPQLPFGK
jgi:hypothetical protein